MVGPVPKEVKIKSEEYCSLLEEYYSLLEEYYSLLEEYCSLLKEALFPWFLESYSGQLENINIPSKQYPLTLF